MNLRIATGMVLLALGGFLTGSVFTIRVMHCQPAAVSLMTQPVGCIGDWISRGLYCHGYDVDGNEVASRAY